jgi:hypothetical protein
VWLSVFAAGAFGVACVGASLTLRDLVPLPPAAAVATIWAVSMAAGVVTARIVTRPLEGAFRVHAGRSRRTLLGEVVEVTTGRVDARFGQARIALAGDDLVVQVRCDRPDNALHRGSHALIVDYDARREAFVVEPLGQHTAQQHEHGG